MILLAFSSTLSFRFLAGISLEVVISNCREEGKILRKLIDCLNTYLLEDGPNLGHQSLEIHSSVQHFVSHFWLATHDRALKVSYSRISECNVFAGYWCKLLHSYIYDLSVTCRMRLFCMRSCN